MTVVALIDGPLPPGESGCVSLLGMEEAPDSPARRHATVLADAICAQAPQTTILSIPVFRGGLSARVSDLVEALRQAAESDAQIVHCSLGLPRNDPWVEAAIRALDDRIVVASAPARGDPVWPAALPSVISVQGDARCGPGQWSALALPTADFGACPHADNRFGIAGASVAAANLTGILAQADLSSPEPARHMLIAGAAFHGRERRLAP